MNSLDRLSRRDFLSRTAKLTAAGLAAPYALESAHATQQPDEWQIGCYTRPWDQYEYRVALDAIAEAGFKYVGLMTTKSKSRLVISVSTTLEEAEQVGQEARKRGLAIPSVYGGGIPVAESLEAGIAGLRKLIDNCAACNAKNLLMGGIGSNDLYQPYYKAIAECCDYAAEKGIGISIKPHGGLNTTGPQCRKTIEMVNHKNFRIWYDPGNIFYYSDGKLDPVNDAATVDGLVVGMCIKDYKHPKNVMVTPGTGQVDFPAVLARLKLGGFTGGPLIVECLDNSKPDQLSTEAKKACLFVKDLTAPGVQPVRRSQAPRNALLAGVATVDITPPVGYRMSGYFRERLSTGTLNPLYAKALVLRQGNESAAMVFCDIIGISPEVSSQARKQASKITGVPAANIMIAATHSHTGPLYCGALRKHFHDCAIAEHGTDTCEKVDYSAQLTKRIVQVIRQADEKTKPIVLEAGAAEQLGLSFNRRFHMKNGTVRFNPGILNPDIVKAAGPIDPQLSTIFVHDKEGSPPTAGIVNFALHLDTTGGTEYAADYPYYCEQALREKFGPQFTLLFGTGTCGDINHIDVTKKERLKPDQIGQTLAETLIATQANNIGEASLAAKSEVIDIPLQKFNVQEIAWAHENIEKVGTSQLSFLDQVKAYKILAVEMRNSPTIPLEVQVFRLSRDVAVVGLPGEVFVDLGLEIKHASPFPTTMVIELCNDSPGYIPTEKGFAEGSYETVNSRIQPSGGEELVKVAINLLNSLTLS